MAIDKGAAHVSKNLQKKKTHPNNTIFSSCLQIYCQKLVTIFEHCAPERRVNRRKQNINFITRILFSTELFQMAGFKVEVSGHSVNTIFFCLCFDLWTVWPLNNCVKLLKCVSDIWMKKGDGGESIYGPVFEGNTTYCSQYSDKTVHMAVVWNNSLKIWHSRRKFLNFARQTRHPQHGEQGASLQWISIFHHFAAKQMDGHQICRIWVCIQVNAGHNAALLFFCERDAKVTMRNTNICNIFTGKSLRALKFFGQWKNKKQTTNDHWRTSKLLTAAFLNSYFDVTIYNFMEPNRLEKIWPSRRWNATKQ